MVHQSTVDAYTAETEFRSVQNSATATQTITANTIAIGAPVVLATATGSLPANLSTSASPFLPGTVKQNWVQRPATATSLVNNLFLGLLAKAPGTKGYLGPEEMGLAQTYGPFVGAIIKRRADTIGSGVGAVLIPEYDGVGCLLPVVGPMTGPASIASTDTAAFTEVPALGGLALACAAIASSSATATGTAVVFLRCR